MAATAPQSDQDFGFDSRALPDPDPDTDASDGGGVSGRHRSQVVMEELTSNRDEEQQGDKEQVDAGVSSGRQDEQVSVDSLINGIGFGAYQRKLLVLCGAGWAADIMDLQVMAFLLPHLNTEWGEPMSRLSLAPRCVQSPHSANPPRLGKGCINAAYLRIVISTWPSFGCAAHNGWGLLMCDHCY